MSRIGKKPITIPEKVKVDIKEDVAFVEGPLGKLQININPGITVSVKDGKVVFERENNEIPVRSSHGAIRSHLNNMIEGVTKGFSKELVINGVGYKAELKGKILDLYVGFSGPKPYQIPDGIKVEIEKGTRVKLSGIDKGIIGKVASEIRSIRPVEPYKEKGIKYSDERIKKKVGKAAVGQTG